MCWRWILRTISGPQDRQDVGLEALRVARPGLGRDVDRLEPLRGVVLEQDVELGNRGCGLAARRLLLAVEDGGFLVRASASGGPLLYFRW
jgi:hypothetical protein